MRRRRPRGKALAARTTVLALAAGALFATLTPLCPAAAQSVRSGAWSFTSNAALAPPAIEVSVGGQPSSGPSEQASGYLLLAPIKNYAHAGAFMGKPGPEIMEADGSPVWEHPLGQMIKVGRSSEQIVAMDFHVDSYEGKPVLVWWEGYITPQGFGNGFWAIIDEHYHTLALIHAPKGYELDFHDIQFVSGGDAYIIISKPVKLSLHCCGGPANGEVEDQQVLEINVKTGKILWRWDPLHHVPLREAYTTPPSSGAWDPYHINSISFTPTGEPIISARNTWAAYWVERKTGRVLARLGGRRSSFTFATGASFAWQHDVRQQQGSQVSVFDDEAAPVEGKQSRALLLTLDSTHHTATIAHEYLLPKPALAGSQGNTQLLEGGNLFVGWGQLPYFSEYNSAGKLIYLASLPGPDESYRAFRSPWVGLPGNKPALVAVGANALEASWNGATEVASWQLLAGASESSLSPSGQPAARQGFETQLAPSKPAAYYAVQALDGSGQILGTSPVVGSFKAPPTSAGGAVAH
jgi:arylsulfotransferase ASST